MEQGGVLFYAHPEEPRNWGRPELAGMEIYNLHTDIKRLQGGLGGLLPDMLLNYRRYPDQVYRCLFQRPTEFLQRWDEMNQTRHITGIAGNDSHQNVGYRMVYTRPDTVRIEDTSPETLREIQLGGFTCPLASWLWRPLKPGQVLLHLQLDPYERSARFVNTHVLAHELTEEGIRDSLQAGRVFLVI